MVRTEKSPLFLPQFAYYKPYLAIDPFFADDTTTKKLQTISASLNLKRPDADLLITELLEKSDFQTSFSVLSAVHDRVQTNQIEQIFNLTAPPWRFDNFLETVRIGMGKRPKFSRRFLSIGTC